MKYLLLVILLAFVSEINAQVPQKMSYQAVIRDASNNLLSLKNISMRISILRGDIESSAVYIESHNSKTNLNGLVSLQIGTGAIMFGSFSKIDWSKGPYYIFTETDPDGGFNYRINGKSELLSVPFALYSLNNSMFDTTSLHNRIIDLQYQALENKNNIEKNIDSIKANAAQSEINIIGIIENTKNITLNLDSIIANSVKIKNNIDTLNTKIDILDLIAILSSYQKVGKIINAFTVDTIDSINIKSIGNLHSSKNIALSGNIESLGANSSIGTIEKPFKDLYISSNSLYIASDLVGQNIPPTILSNLNGNLQISSGGFKLMGANASFIAPRIEGRLIGNANTSTKFETARTINGVLFDGSANIELPDYDDNYTKISQLNGTDSFNINIKGNLGSSGNVTVAGNIEAFGTTSTLGTLEKPFKGLFISSGSLSIASDTLGKDIPAAVLSNVEGNLQISAGGLKLMGDNTSFIAPRIVSTLTGNASTATKLDTARKINGVNFDGSKDITIATTAAYSLIYTNTGTGDIPGGSYDGSLIKTISYNSIGASSVAGSTLITTLGTINTGAIPYTLLTGSVPIWNQSTLGNAATVTTNANLTGVVTSIGNATSIASGTITNSMIANIAVATLSGTNTGDQVLPTLVSLGAVANNTLITGATKTKLTYDTKGLVTAGIDATTADIAASANKNYVTDVQSGVISNTSGANTGDESTATIKTKLGITTLTGSNTGDQVLPTLATLGAVASNTLITGATKTKLTYDTKGLVTAGTDATTADIAASTNKNYVTDIQSGVLSNTSGANTGDESTTTIKTKLGITTLTGSNTGDQINITGNAGTATKLATTKLINGVAFDGSSDISITAIADAGTLSGTTLNATILNSSLTSIGTLGSLTVTNPITGSVTGNAATVTTNANLTGVVTSIGNATSIASGTITNSMIANTAVANLSGTNSGDQVLPTLATLGAVASNTLITGATKTKLTYDTKGLVTAGTDATTADISASTNKNYVTDVQAGVISNTSGANTGDESTATIKTKLGITTLTGSNTGDQINITGNAATATSVSGIVGIANGGTNSNATPTAGSIIYGTGTAQAYTLAGTTGQFLQSTGTGVPIWGQPGPSSVTVLTSLTPGSTYNVPNGVKAIMIEIIGGGGGSGGSVVAGSSKGTASGGGGSGSYTRVLITNPLSSYLYTIGLGGTGGTTLGTNGGNGGQTSFNGTTITAPGGSGGQGCTSATSTNGYLAKAGGVGGTIGLNGNFSVPGHDGGIGIVMSVISIGGSGANSVFGDGPSGKIVTTGQTTGLAIAATGFGAGASGSAVLNAAAKSGAAGYQGVIIITEFK